MKKYKVGLVDVSHWHRENYFGTLEKMPEVEIAAVSDADASYVRDAVKRYGCAGYGGKAELLSNKEIDVVIILSPHREMAGTAIKALEAGKHVWIEKPAGVSSSEVENVFKKADALNLKAIVPLVCRKDPAMHEALSLIGSGMLGEVTNTCLRVIAGPPSRYTESGSGWMLDPAVSGGGVLRNMGIHLADLSRLATGSDPVSIYACVNHSAHREKVEDSACVLMKMKSGALNCFELGYGPADCKGEMTYEVRGVKGVLKIHNGVESEIYCSAKPEFAARRTRYETAPGIRPSYGIYMKNFLASITEGAAEDPPRDDIVKALRIVDLAYRSAREGNIIDCKEEMV